MDSIENVYQAIELFNGQNAEQSAVAAKWLSEFQKSVYAWQTADTLLQQNRHYHSCYFGAQTIRQKILHDFRELPPETYASLKDSLIQHLKRVEVQNPDHYAVIVTQLSLALADLYLQVPEWIGFIAEIVNMFATGNDGALNIMLSLLRVFPEELGGRHLKLGSNRREAVQQELAGNFDTLIQCLTQILASHQGSLPMIKKVIQCITPWVNNPLNRTENFAASSLLHDMLQLLTATNFPSDIYEANCEALSNAVILCEDMKNHYKLATVLQGIYASAEVFTALVAAEDFEKCASLARLYVELAESFLAEIANNPGKGLGDLRTLDLILLVVGHHDYSMAEMTFSVWYRLSEFIFQITDDDSFSWLLNNFKPYVERYILCLYRHCQLDVDYEGVQDDKDDFIEFRERAAETIKDVSFIISSISLIKSMVHLIETNQTGNWNEVESALFILSTVIGNINENEETAVPTVLKIIENFAPTTHVALLNTAAEVLGSTAEWFETHDELMYRAFNWLISLSSKQELLKSAGESIESICKVSGGRLRMYFNQLVEFMHRVESCQTNGVRAEAAAQAILRSCALLLNDLPSNDIATQLEDLCRDPIDRLRLIAAAYGTELKDGNENARDSWARASTDPLIWIDRLTSIFKTLKPWNLQEAFKLECSKLNVVPDGLENIPELQVPWLQLGGRVWDGILLILEAYQSNYRTVEHCCRCLRYLIRSMGAQSVMFVGNLADLIMRVYNSHPHSCFLYLASVIVDEYGLFGNILPDLLKMAEMIANRSFIIFQQSNGFQNHPDTIDDLFRLAFRFVQKVPEAFCTNPLSRNFFECGIAALELDHVDAHRSVTKFFEETLKYVQMTKGAGNINHPAVLSIDQLFQEMGERIVWHSIHGSLFTLSQNLKKDISEFLFEIMKTYRLNFDGWLRSAIQRLVQERGSLGASPEQLEKFHSDVIKSTRVNEFNYIMKDLCRLYS